MKKLIPTFLFCFFLTQLFGQTQKKISTFLFAQYNKTIYSATSGNNPSGIGLGLQTFLNNKTKFKPTIEITGDLYLENDKVYRTDLNGTPLNDVPSMVNLFIGSSFQQTQNFFFSFVAGPSFISGQTLFGIKPSIGFYFSKNQRWTGKLSYINIFNQDKVTKEDFGTISFAIGVKLF
ncbi:MAG: hypothetical protein M3004_11880 [Bacteroidota bacterium]|nr:hypothetical protein [Bacteroidota bacterium]